MCSVPGLRPNRKSFADFHENDHRFHLKSINVLSLGDHYRSEATLA